MHPGLNNEADNSPHDSEHRNKREGIEAEGRRTARNLEAVDTIRPNPELHKDEQPQHSSNNSTTRQTCEDSCKWVHETSFRRLGVIERLGQYPRQPQLVLDDPDATPNRLSPTAYLDLLQSPRGSRTNYVSGPQ